MQGSTSSSASAAAATGTRTSEAVGEVDHITMTSVIVNGTFFLMGLAAGRVEGVAWFRRWLKRHDEIVIEEHAHEAHADEEQE